MKNKYAIVVPIYHEPQALLDICFNSIQQQTYTNWICYIVNDGTIFKKPEDPRFIVIDVEHCLVGAKRNYGIRKALNCDYVMFVDADDSIDKNMIEVADGIVKDNKAVDIIYFENENVVGNKVSISDLSNIRKRLFNGKVAKELGLGFFLGHPISIRMTPAWGKIFSTALLKNNGIYFPENITIGEDNVFAIDCSIYSSLVVYVDNYLPYKRLKRENSAVHTNFTKTSDEYFLLINKVLSASKYYPEWKKHFPRNIIDVLLRDLMSDEGKKVYKRSKDIKDRLKKEFSNKDYLNLLKIKESFLTSKKRLIKRLIVHHHYFLLSILLTVFRKRS